MIIISETCIFFYYIYIKIHINILDTTVTSITSVYHDYMTLNLNATWVRQIFPLIIHNKCCSDEGI